MCQEALGLERSNGGERTESKCRKDKDHDMQYRPGPPAEFRHVSMHHLSHWSRQQQHLLQWLQALGTLITDVHGARELRAPWTADHRGKSQVGPDKLEVVASFCYLGDLLSAASGCELSTTTHVKTTWKKFKKLLPVLSSSHLSLKTYGRMYSFCVQSAMLHASETWPLTKPNLQHL